MSTFVKFIWGLFLLLALACRNNLPKHPNNVQKSAKKSENPSEEDGHRAPPPAYGNKVVKNK